ncbi:MAG: hypothetical protein E5V85_13655, partial [Mesorhizobium sp.]
MLGLHARKLWVALGLALDLGQQKPGLRHGGSDRHRLAGKIGGFGWSTDHPKRLAAYAPRVGFIAVENDFNVFTPAKELMAVAARENLVSFSRLPLAMGLLTGKYTPGMKVPANDVRGGNAEWMVFFRDGAANPHYLSRLEAIR